MTTKEFNLSDKESICHKGVFYIEDVKEFIRLLKEEIELKIVPSKIIKGVMVGLPINPIKLRDKLLELAGEKLK